MIQADAGNAEIFGKNFIDNEQSMYFFFIAVPNLMGSYNSQNDTVFSMILPGSELSQKRKDMEFYREPGVGKDEIIARITSIY